MNDDDFQHERDPERRPDVDAEPDSQEEPEISKLTRLDEPGGGRVSRRDLLNAASALGLGAGAASLAGDAEAASERRGKISYIVCNRALNAPVKKVGFSVEQHRLAALSSKGRLRLWDTRQLGQPLEFRAGTRVEDFFWGPGELLLVETTGGRLTGYDMSSDEELFSFKVKDLQTAGFSADGEWLILLYGDGRLERRASRSGETVQETDLAAMLEEIGAGHDDVARVSSLGMSRHAPAELYVATPRDIFQLRLDNPVLTKFRHPVESFDELIVSGSGELVAYLFREEGKADVFMFPAARPWRLAVEVKTLSERLDFSPSFDSYVAVNDRVVVYKPTETTVQELSGVAKEVDTITALTSSWEPGVHAWGGEDGRVMMLIGEEGSSGRFSLKTIVDPELAKVTEHKPEDAWRPNHDCTCTCNSVEVKQNHNERISQEWDSANEVWSTRTQPCGVPIPAGAVCVCNCVSAPSSPIWRTICTCNTVCTCNPQSSYRTLTYWY